MPHRLVLRLDRPPIVVRLLGPAEPWPDVPARTPPQQTTLLPAKAPVSSDKETLQRLAESIHQALVLAAKSLDQQKEIWRQAAIELATLLATHFLQRSVEIGQFPWPALINEMIQSSQGATWKVRLHPEDLQALKTHGKDLSEITEVSIVPDGQLRRGECLVETDTEVRFHSMTERLRAARELLLRDWNRDPI